MVLTNLLRRPDIPGPYGGEEKQGAVDVFLTVEMVLETLLESRTSLRYISAYEKGRPFDTPACSPYS